MVPRRNGRATAVVTAPVRCAVYTRKSTTAGLDGNFTSLHNQRERAEAYIDSQRDQGWTLVSTPYDDGGFSGGNLERPALRQLLADVEAQRVDAIAVYRLDRLSRSLVDFGRVHEFLEKHGVALVSVTESINTSTSAGRMMVNVLLSFAQYERELVGERTRDKLGAARRRGKFVGGYQVLGYDLADSRLVVNAAEAEHVREIFRLFLERRSLVSTAEELRRRGWTLKRWTTKGGKVYGGGRFNKITLRRLLTNHVYVGKVQFQGTVYDGEHDGIVPTKLFREVQAVLDGNLRNRGASQRNKHGALLRGLLQCSACGTAMVHAPVRRGARLHRYYRCTTSIRQGAASCPSKPVRADRIETFVVDTIKKIGADPELQQATFEQAAAQVRAKRRGLKLEATRLKADLAAARTDVQRLVETVSRVTGPAADAVAAQLATAQERVTAIETRLAEITTEMATLDPQALDREELARALEAFDPVWDVLLTPERERVLQLIIERIDYDGGTQQMALIWRLAGFGELAAEVAP